MKMENYLINLVQHLGLQEDEFKVEVTEADGEVNVNLSVPDTETGLFVGYKAEVINAMQRMLRVIFSKDYEDKRISLNINNYREDRLTQLREKLQGISEKLVEPEDEYVFPPISSFERFNIHSIISTEAEFSDFESYSEGEGNERRLIIRRKQA